MGLYVRTTGEPQVIQEEIRNYRSIAKPQFAENGIPVEALAAVNFVEVGESNDDLQVVYAIQEGDRIGYYRGYCVPGFGGPTEWKKVKLR